MVGVLIQVTDNIFHLKYALEHQCPATLVARRNAMTKFENLNSGKMLSMLCLLKPMEILWQSVLDKNGSQVAN